MKPCARARVYQKEWLTNLKEKRKKKKEKRNG
jgi:hypothetical protein